MPTCRSLSLLFPARCRHAAGVVAITAAFSLIAAGCGGGGHGGSGTTAGDSAGETAQARTDLSTLVAGTNLNTDGLSGVDMGKLTAIRDRFALAYGANHNNTEAAFGTGGDRSRRDCAGVDRRGKHEGGKL